MNKVVLSPAFQRAYKRFTRKRPQSISKIRTAIEQLELDHLHPSLRTHKLGGEFEETWSCTSGYDLRILFEIVRNAKTKQTEIHLLTIGTHDDVY
jgi:addiction module RelE/StbE family toxin